jgi:Flp pilus assembly protein TadB
MKPYIIFLLLTLSFIAIGAALGSVGLASAGFFVVFFGLPALIIHDVQERRQARKKAEQQR